MSAASATSASATQADDSTGWRTGFCGITSTGEGDACLASHTKGSWTALNVEDCHARCVACSRCYFISWSSGDRDCSWFSRCNVHKLRDQGSGHVTRRIRTPSGEPYPVEAAHRPSPSSVLERVEFHLVPEATDCCRSARDS